MTHFIFRHIVRAKTKSALVTVVTIFFIVALGFMQESIYRVAADIDQMYDSLIVRAEVRQRDTRDVYWPRRFGDIIRERAVREVLDSGFTQNEFVEALHVWAMITPAAESGYFPECWYEVWTEPVLEHRRYRDEDMNGLMGFNDLELFLAENSRTGATIDRLGIGWLDEHRDNYGNIDWDSAGRMGTGALQIEFAPGFDESYFVFSAGKPIPVLLYEPLMQLRGINFGEIAYISSFSNDTLSWVHTPAVAIGTHNGNFFRWHEETIMLPLDALKHIFENVPGHALGYTVLSFEIDPAFNREILTVREEIDRILRHQFAGWVSLSLTLYDEELRMVVGSMEQNLSLLQMLYPIAIVVSAIIGFGISLMLMLQSVKRVSIMRVLGLAKVRTQVILCIEQLFVALAGLVIGAVVVWLFDWDLVKSVLFVSPYIAGVLVGSGIGVVLVTNKSPLEMLQVKE